MRKIVHSLTLLLVLYHTLVGCCWHHAHGEGQSTRPDAPEHVACCGHSHEGHDHRHQSSEGSDGSDNGCDHGQCEFLVPPTGDDIGIADRLAADNGLCLVSFCGGILPSNGCDASESPPPSGPPPLRLHLVNQIFLI
jgi:hypothetical protein